MRTYRFMSLPIIVALLSLIPSLPALSANSVDRPLGEITALETKQAFTEVFATPSEPARAGMTPLQGAWADQLENSLNTYKTMYPASNFDSYTASLGTVKRALSAGKKEVVRAQMGVWLKMLRTRSHGINDVAADELFHYSVMVAPIQEYRISVPPPVEFGIPRLGHQ